MDVQAVDIPTGRADEQYHAPWDPTTDRLEIGDDPHYGAVSNKYGFEPKVKINTRDFKVVAFQPDQWKQLDLPKEK